MTETSPDGLHKQVHDAPDWDAELNDNFDIVQTLFNERAVDLVKAFLAANRNDIVANAGVFRRDFPDWNAASDLSQEGKYYIVEWDSPTQGADAYFDAGWVQDVPVVDATGWWDMTFPARTWLKLPRGLYLWDTYIELSAPMSSSVQYVTFMEYVHDPGAHFWTFLRDSQSALKASAFLASAISAAGMLAVEDDDTAFVPNFRIPAAGGVAGTVVVARLNMAKVG